MTQSAAPPPTRGAVRSAVEALLRTCADLERRADEVAEQSRARAAHVTGEVARSRSAALTARVEALTHQLDADLRDHLSDLRRPYVTEIHALLALLAPWHGLAPLPPLPPSPAGATLSDHFPAGFARTYVADLLTGVDGSTSLGREPAAATTPPSADDIANALAATRRAFAAEYADEGMRLIEDATCHAVQRHGAHLSDGAHLAR